MSTLESTIVAGERVTADHWLIDLYLKDQQQLTAVERFARLHETGDLEPNARRYAELMPIAPPGPGEQYAFEVDLDQCSGCKSCVTACHSLNGLDEHEIWREVGLLHGGTTEAPLVQHVTTACHHCVDPACLNACPVNAYEKDPLTGIVRHLDDQCFGCQYCILACPYDVPKYNKQKGIVRKCDMCRQRIAVDEAPACVQACPHQAIRIRVVSKTDILADCESNPFLPGAPDPQYTLPTTNYRTSRPLPRNTLPADYFALRREHSHVPLVVMLVLTQLSVGAFLIDLLLSALARFDSPLGAEMHPAHVASALCFGLLALAASVLHLGRPQYAFKAVLGLKHSWLSREILAFGIFAKLAIAYAASMWLWPPAGDGPATWQVTLGAAVVACGLLGVFCSVMVYQCTRRPFWNGTYAGGRFFLTTLVLGLSAILFTSVVVAALSSSLTLAAMMTAYGLLLCRVLVVVVAVKLALEGLVFLHLASRQTTPLKRTALLMTGELARPTTLRFVVGALAGIAIPGMIVGGGSDLGSALFGAALLLSFVATMAGELLERYLFFTASVAPRMPGGLS